MQPSHKFYLEEIATRLRTLFTGTPAMFHVSKVSLGRVPVDDPSVDHPSVDHPSVDNPCVEHPFAENLQVGIVRLVGYYSSHDRCYSYDPR